MPRPATGAVVERRRVRGRVYALRFTAFGERRYLTLPDGTTRAQAEQELANVLADVRRGVWQPADPPAEAPPPILTFHEFASEWLDRRRHEVESSTAEAIEWRLSYVLLPFFAEHRLSEITPREIDLYRQAQVRERDRLRALRERGEPIPCRPLSNATINRTIGLLAQILEVAVEYDLIPTNPAVGKRRRLKIDRPRRAYLDSAGHIGALLEAARDLDQGAREDRKHIPRRTILATLVFAGLRIGELLDLRWRDVDLATGWLHVRQAKTGAGVRKVKIRPALRDELLAHKATTAYDGSAAFVFGTSAGKRQSASNVRVRVLARALERANERLDERCEAPLPALTPHGLRRSFASLLYAIGEPPPVVMAEMGHTDPALALAIYAQVMRRDEGETARLRETVEGVSPEAAPSDGRAEVRGG
jgi:integrase